MSDPLLQNPAVMTYRGIAKTTPNEEQRKEIAAQVVDVDLWGEAVKHWDGHGWNKRNVTSILAMYLAGGPDSCSMCHKNGNGSNKSTAYDQTTQALQRAMAKARANE